MADDLDATGRPESPRPRCDRFSTTKGPSPHRRSALTLIHERPACVGFESNAQTAPRTQRPALPHAATGLPSQAARRNTAHCPSCPPTSRRGRPRAPAAQPARPMLLTILLELEPALRRGSFKWTEPKRISQLSSCFVPYFTLSFTSHPTTRQRCFSSGKLNQVVFSKTGTS